MDQVPPKKNKKKNTRRCIISYSMFFLTIHFNFFQDQRYLYLKVLKKISLKKHNFKNSTLLFLNSMKMEILA